MLSTKTNFGKMKDSPCQTCIVKMLCNEWCLKFSNYVSRKIINMSIDSFKPVKIPRRES
jgi:hypothetical protein